MLEHDLEGLIGADAHQLEQLLGLGGHLLQDPRKLCGRHALDLACELLHALRLRQRAEKLLRAGQDGVREAREAPLLEVNQAVGNVEYAVVMGHQQDRAPIPLGQLMEALDDFAPRLLVERRRRLVGEDDTRAPGESASDGDPLLLPGGELVRVFTRVLFEADAA